MKKILFFLLLCPPVLYSQPNMCRVYGTAYDIGSDPAATLDRIPVTVLEIIKSGDLFDRYPNKTFVTGSPNAAGYVFFYLPKLGQAKIKAPFFGLSGNELLSIPNADSVDLATLALASPITSANAGVVMLRDSTTGTTFTTIGNDDTLEFANNFTVSQPSTKLIRVTGSTDDANFLLKSAFRDSIDAQYDWRSAYASPAAGDSVWTVRDGVTGFADVGDLPGGGGSSEWTDFGTFLKAADAADIAWHLTDAAEDDSLVIDIGTDGSVTFTTVGGDMDFATTGNANALVIRDSNGRVGINTNSLNTELNIGGNRNLSFIGGGGTITSTAGTFTLTAGTGTILLTSDNVRVGGDVTGGKFNVVGVSGSALSPVGIQQGASGGADKLVSIRNNSGTETMGINLTGFETSNANQINNFDFFHDPTTSPDVGDGVGFSFKTNDPSNLEKEVARIQAIASDMTAGAMGVDLSFSVIAKGVLQEYVRIFADSTLTTNTTNTTIATFSTDTDVSYFITAHIQGVNATMDSSYHYEYRIAARNDGGTLSLLPGTPVPLVTFESVSQNNPTVTTSGANVLIQMASSFNSTIDWRTVFFVRRHDF